MGGTSHTEWFRSAIGQVSLTWDELGAPFIVEMPKDKSATGKHEMFSLFVESPSVRATINGKAFQARRSLASSPERRIAVPPFSPSRKLG